MWSRRLSVSMVFNHDDFVKALKLALSDGSIIEKLTDVVTNKLKLNLILLLTVIIS